MKFQELKVRQLSRALVKSMYMTFSSHRDYWFKDQILRACVSIMNNVAEGNGRDTASQFSHFLNIAAWSANEVKSMLYVWLDVWYISEDQLENLYENVSHVCSMLIKFKKSLLQKTLPMSGSS